MQKLISVALLMASGFFSACAQPAAEQPEEKSTQANEAKKNKSVHPYGGWYCPDNLGGFPPVNIADLANVPVVNGRMPTAEETRNGTSLMYFDPADYPSAKPLNIFLPKLAHYYSEHTKQLELVIVIQAVVVDADTVVGFRYVDGGNGTSWFNEVSFLSDKEIAAAGATPFVYLEADFDVTKEKVWAAITQTAYAKKLGQKFGKETFFASPWTSQSREDLHYEIVGESANGYAMMLFGNVYMQIDYDYNGRQAVEKVLILDNQDGKGAKMQVVFGPYTKDIARQQALWEAWLKEVKTLCVKS